MAETNSENRVEKKGKKDERRMKKKGKLVIKERKPLSVIKNVLAHSYSSSMENSKIDKKLKTPQILKKVASKIKATKEDSQTQEVSKSRQLSSNINEDDKENIMINELDDKENVNPITKQKPILKKYKTTAEIKKRALKEINTETQKSQRLNKEYSIKKLRKTNRRDWLDQCDSNHQGDSLYCLEYAKIICDHYKKLEEKYQPSPSYMDFQNDINSKMRVILIDWMIEVQQKFTLSEDTFFLSVNIIDRFLSENSISRSRYQLLGCASMFIASKYEEVLPPEANDYVFISDGAYTKKDLLVMESKCMNTLNWNIKAPTPRFFSMRFLDIVSANKKQRLFCMLLIELSAANYSILRFNPSLIAASAVYISLHLKDDNNKNVIWSKTLEKQCYYSLEDMDDCIYYLIETLKHNNAEEKSIKKKYIKKDNLKVSSFIRKVVDSFSP